MSSVTNAVDEHAMTDADDLGNTMIGLCPEVQHVVREPAGE